MNRLGNGAALSILLLLPTLTAFFVQRAWVAEIFRGRDRQAFRAPVRPGLKADTRTFLLGLSYSPACLSFRCTERSSPVASSRTGIDYSFTTSNIVEALQRGRRP